MAGEDAAAQTVFANIPLWEPYVFGNPLYIWIILFLGFFIVMMAMAFKLEVYDRLEPVWGHREASFRNIPEAIVHGMSGKIWIMPVDSVAGIFSAMGLPLRWIQTVPTQGQLGKVNVIELEDSWNIVHNVKIDLAIVEAAHAWNAEMKKRGFKEGDVDDNGISRFIYNWDTFEAHLMNGDLETFFPKGITLPPLLNVDFHEIRRYLPKWTASHHSGYINAELEKRKPEEDQKKGYTIVAYAVAAGTIMIVCAAIAYVILHS